MKTFVVIGLGRFGNAVVGEAAAKNIKENLTE